MFLSRMPAMAHSRRPLFIALATLVAALPAASAPPSPPVQVWIDVATHDMAGMPDLGGLGGLAGRMMGNQGPQTYPEARNIPASTGKLLDIAMLNGLRPGVEAEQLVPNGLGVGKSLPLLPSPSAPRKDEASSPAQSGDVEVTIRQYWGCGATVRPGQPKVMTMRMKKGAMEMSGSVAPGMFVPDGDINPNPSYALWPNRKNAKRVPDRSSMVGQHQITGDGVPASLKFELGQSADFMPKIALQTRGELAESIALSWRPVDRSRAYFINAMGMQDESNLVLWSSSEVAGAGHELLNYLTGSHIDKWLQQKVLLSPAATSCTIPQGIFKSTGAGNPGGGMAMLSMIAYGPETNIAWPPKPADAKQPWKPEWSVRVRSKSTSTAMLGMDLSGMDVDSSASDGEKQPQEEESQGKKILKGLLRNF